MRLHSLYLTEWQFWNWCAKNIANPRANERGYSANVPNTKSSGTLTTEDSVSNSPSHQNECYDNLRVATPKQIKYGLTPRHTLQPSLRITLYRKYTLSHVQHKTYLARKNIKRSSPGNAWTHFYTANYSYFTGHRSSSLSFLWCGRFKLKQTNWCSVNSRHGSLLAHAKSTPKIAKLNIYVPLRNV